LRDLTTNFAQGNLYIAEEDIQKIPCFSSETLVAVRAPHGTTLEVPDPDEGMEHPKKRYQIFLKSTSGPVEVFLVALHEELADQLATDEFRVAEPLSVSPSGDNVSLMSKSNARGEPPVAANDSAHFTSTRSSVKDQSAVTALALDENSAGTHPPFSGGGGIVSSPTILRIMPPEVDPDYWFSDEVKELGIGLFDVFAPAGTDCFYNGQV
jgi:transcription factor E2F3